MNRTLVSAAVGAALLAAGGYAGYWYAKRSGHDAMAAAAPAAKADAGRKVLYWHDPMYPQQKFDKPGRSPFMDMDLVPVYADDGADAGGVKVSPRVVQNLGVRTAVAEKGRLEVTVEAVGTVAFDERAVTLVQSRTPGYIEKLFVRAPLDPVKKGQPLAQLFVPEWAGAQEEYLALRRSTAPGAQELARAARNRLLLLNMSEEQIAEVEREGRPQPRITLASPVDGVVGELGAREGMTLMPGGMLFRINGLSTVWVNVDIPEAQAGAVVPGAPITATVPAYPGEKFGGRLNAVLPDVVAASRTVRARVELANPGGKLKPGMYANLAIAPAASREAVLVPSEAVIPTGRRTVIVVDRGDSKFEPVEVETGREQGGRTEILKGLDAGARVVVSGQFLIDSEASLKATTTRMGEAGGKEYQADAKLEKFGKDTWTITHGPVPELKWGAMTMEFLPMKGGVPAEAKPGQEVRLSFVLDKDGMPVVTKIAPKGSAK
ncbi:MAG: efflux RND transporter periplasmic adaptor subunit [Betaproteobacteria bacterium]|nr:MAG: efflux RND transporter periplasmic adaptor subunit [Betaproteobacteria bacterium]